MSAEEEKGFIIRDRRGRAEDAASPGEAGAVSGAVPRPDQPAPAQESAQTQDLHPPLTFASFVFSLGTSALMLMGEQLDPQQGRAPVNLPQAKEIIDILSMLEAKTQGNLTAEEQAVLTDLLYALRMKYVDLASGKQVTQAS